MALTALDFCVTHINECQSFIASSQKSYTFPTMKYIAVYLFKNVEVIFGCSLVFKTKPTLIEFVTISKTKKKKKPKKNKNR